MTPGEKRLLAAYRQLDDAHRKTLEEFCEFLLGKSEQREGIPTHPVAIERPAEESVIKAIKRLTATYPMLDPGKLFNDTSRLMSLHVMQGRPARDVIDELEAVFAQCYAEYGEQR